MINVDLTFQLNLPVIFHCRVAHDDLIDFLTTKYKIQNTNLKGVVHCFTGNGEQAEKFLEMGFYLAFNGLILKDVPALPDPVEVIKRIPLERILLETDSPYLTPPQLKDERNEPLNVKYVAKKIAAIKNISFEKIAEITAQNAKTLFQI